MVILQKSFYKKNTLKVAQELLGCFLVRAGRGKIWRARITETEGYRGEDDLASHASRGRTPRTELMYGQPGHAYVYMIYGMYHCLNIVTEKKDFPAAVLIRGVEIANDLPLLDKLARPFGGERVGVKLNGPGKLCKFLKIDRKLNGLDMTKGEKLWIEARDRNISKRNIVAGKRIGVDYAKQCKEYLWRFTLSSRACLSASGGTRDPENFDLLLSLDPRVRGDDKEARSKIYEF
jgi:DNA-3-methyladenine glycosylase